MQTRDKRLALFWRRAMACHVCPTLAPWRKFPPAARGNPNHGIMILGEAPGRVSLDQGRPFSNPRNLTVRQALARAFAPYPADPAQVVYFSDTVKCWPNSPSGANRSPSTGETQRCIMTHLARELAIIRPRVVFAFGVRAATALLGTPLKLAELHGRAIDDGRGFRVIPLMHPSGINIAGMQRVGLRTLADYEDQLADLFRRELLVAGAVWTGLEKAKACAG